jgi:hypothetical protein
LPDKQSLAAVPIVREKYAGHEEPGAVVAVDRMLEDTINFPKGPGAVPRARRGLTFVKPARKPVRVIRVGRGHVGRGEAFDAQSAIRLNRLKCSKPRRSAVRDGCDYNGMNRACCAAGIMTLLDARDSTKRLAVMKSASENAATNDAHANCSPTPISATPPSSMAITRKRRLRSHVREKVAIATGGATHGVPALDQAEPEAGLKINPEKGATY